MLMFMQIKLIFKTRVLQLASFWKREFLEQQSQSAMQHNSDPVSTASLKVANRSFTSAQVNRHGRWNCNRKIKTRRLHYNPRQKLWGCVPLLSWFCTDYASNQRFTFLNTTLTRLPNSLPLNKMDVKNQSFSLLKPETVQGVREGGWFTIFIHEWQIVPTFWPRL